MTVPNEAQAAVEAARQNLARSLGVPAQSLTLVRVEAVEWPNSALGCPAPGRVYLQVITPGFRIVFNHSGTHYELHTDAPGRVVVRC